MVASHGSSNPPALRIGAVPYGVGAPLATGLDDDPEVALLVDKPARLIEGLRSGDLDAGLVSSIEAFRRPGYVALPEIGICCRGPVESVRAFWRPPRLERVGLDDASETSVALLRILLGHRFPEAAPHFERIEATRAPDALPQDLVLLIGDNGFHADPGTREVWDLGEEWRAMTDGLPFVFALWLIRPGADLERVAAALRRARDKGRNAPSIHEGSVHYDVGIDETRALERFHVEAARIGLAESDVHPTLFRG